MNELKLVSKHPGSLKPLVESALAEALRSVEDGIRRTKQRIQDFETKYHSTEEFLQRYEDDEFQEPIDLDEWIGESLLLKGLQEDADRLSGIEFAS